MRRLPWPPLPLRIPPRQHWGPRSIPPPACRNSSSIAPDVESERLLQRLLEPCENVTSAKNELRWLGEHARKITPGDSEVQRATLRRLVEERATGKPLQYILGTEYFGDLELECRPGVLIPRQETAASVSHLVDILSKAPNLPTYFRVLDLCTGSGCIPLLFQHQLGKTRPDIKLRMAGVDISREALQLAQDNRIRVLQDARLRLKQWEESQIQHQRAGKEYKFPRPRTEALEATEFIAADVLTKDSVLDLATTMEHRPPSLEAVLKRNTTIKLSSRGTYPRISKSRIPHNWQVLICNPPYISPTEFLRTTSRSVRDFEPKMALVPPASSVRSRVKQSDIFYPRILEIAHHVNALVVLVEVADMKQALRVAQMVRNFGESANEHKRPGYRRPDKSNEIQIWRDQPGHESANGTPVSTDGFDVVGRGNARSVVYWRYGARRWFGNEKLISKQIANLNNPVAD